MHPGQGIAQPGSVQQDITPADNVTPSESEFHNPQTYNFKYLMDCVKQNLVSDQADEDLANTGTFDVK